MASAWGSSWGGAWGSSWGSSVLVVVDTHDGGKAERARKRFKDENEARRQQIREAIEPPAPVVAKTNVLSAAVAAETAVEQEAEDEMILMLFLL